MRSRACSPDGSRGCGRCSKCRANWKRATAPRQPDKLPPLKLQTRLSLDSMVSTRHTQRGPVWILTPCQPFAAEDHRPTEALRKAWGWPPINDGYMQRGAFGPIRNMEAA